MRERENGGGRKNVRKSGTEVGIMKRERMDERGELANVNAREQRDGASAAELRSLRHASEDSIVNELRVNTDKVPQVCTYMYLPMTHRRVYRRREAAVILKSSTNDPAINFVRDRRSS